MNQPATLRISRKGIRKIRITPFGWAFILLTLGIGIAGLNTGNNLLYLIFGMLLSMILTNAILSTSSLHNLSLNFYFPERLYVGSLNPVQITLSNHKKRLPSFALTLLPPATEANQGRGYFVFKVTAGAEQSFVHYHTFSERGRHRLPAFRLHTSYPFGLIEKFIPIPLAGERVIFPEVYRLEADPLSQSFYRGDYLSGSAGIGVNPYGIRQHQYGDDVRHIHWPSFAKVGQWMIKEFEKEKKTLVNLQLQVANALPTDPAAKLRREKAVSQTASLLMHFIEEQRQVALFINQYKLEPHDLHGYIDFYLTALSLFDKDPAILAQAETTLLPTQSGLLMPVSEAP